MAKRGWVGASALAMLLAAQAPSALADSGNGVGTAFELAFWQSIGASEDAGLYDAYLQQYPQGTFAALARAKLVALRRAGAPAAAPAMPAVAAVPAVAATPAATSLPAAAPLAAPAPLPVPVSGEAAPAPAATASSGPALAMAAPLGLPGRPGMSPVAAAGASAALGQMLAELARTQETPAPGIGAAGTGAPAALPAAVAAVSPVSDRHGLPPRPHMASVPDVALPSSFCSAEARNLFHDSIYRPAVDAAKRNNDAAVAYLKTLQGIYDGYDLGHDTEAMNALAAEARAYQAEAATTFSQQAALVRAFDELMAVPIAPCGGSK
ncbi:hypothetical protein [Novosphingobium huizhouense]|uniref:hypothetical protein n=1 Tax=Novosphingobium huizhouense TaxID=2866625 RepID=UPI001CD8CDF6|nr:hypothetical protein [Novosphingobium huizhouense]